MNVAIEIKTKGIIELKQVGTWHEPLTTAGKSIDSVASFETLAMKIAYALAFSKPESLQ